MVRAVNIDESPNTLGSIPKKSSSESVSIINPEEEVEFDIDFSNDNEILFLNNSHSFSSRSLYNLLPTINPISNNKIKRINMIKIFMLFNLLTISGRPKINPT